MKFLQRAYCRTFQTVFKLVMPLMPYREPKLENNYNDLATDLLDAGGRRVLIVTDKTLHNLGLTKQVEESLLKMDMKVAVFDEVLPNPTIKQIETGLEIYKNNNCNCIVALGGGSVMDCAKMIGARAVKPNQSVAGMKGLLHINKKLPPFAAIPTTAGTGSEATVTAVITDDTNHKKYPINDFCLIPHFAYLNPELTLGLGKFTTAATGMDALTHAIEAYIGRATTYKTRDASLRAIKLIKDNILYAYDNGKDYEARKYMLNASYLAGVAFTRSYVGYVHAIAHSLGGKYNIAHGYANAVILPLILKTYGENAHKKLAEISDYINLIDKNLSEKEKAEAVINWIEELNQKFGFKTYFDELQEKDIEELVRAANAEANPLYPVPKLLDKDELEHVYQKLLAR